MTASLGSETVAAVGRCSHAGAVQSEPTGVLLSFCKSTLQPAAKNSTECARSPLKTKDFFFTCLGGLRSSSYGIFRSASTGTAGEGSQLGNTENDRPIVRCRYWLLAVSAGGHAHPGILHHNLLRQTVCGFCCDRP